MADLLDDTEGGTAKKPLWRRHMLTDVHTTASGMEYSVHKCPQQYKSDLAAMFPGVAASEVLIVPTCQNSAVDLVRTGDDIEREKDRLLEEFVAWAKAVCAKLAEQSYFADYIDPCSGLPMIHRGNNAPYSEVDALATLLGYACANAGCCKVVLHPKWGSSVYPATLFTTAPLQRLLDAIDEVGRAGSG